MGECDCERPRPGDDCAGSGWRECEKCNGELLVAQDEP